MKKKVSSLLFVLVGVGLWFGLASTARFSIKKWDAKFETVLRHSLNDLGLKDKDLLSSVHQINKDDRGEWVIHRVSLKNLDGPSFKSLRKKLQSSGADVIEKSTKEGKTLLVKRGSRVYQEITITNPL